MIRLIVFETYPLYHIGIQEIFKNSLEIQVVVFASDTDTFFPLLADTPAEVVLLGVNPNDNLLCLDVAQRIRRDYPLLKILAYADEDTEQTVLLLLEADIQGCIGKRSDRDELRKAILKVAAGDEYIGKIEKIQYYKHHSRNYCSVPIL
jgi:Response regulator containing a CheY-like receiver domain and an HTH DNA-binding domain